MTSAKGTNSRMKRQGVVVFLLGTVLVPAFAQQAAPLPVNDVLTARSFAEYSPIQFSPDGRWLSYTVQEHRQSEFASSEEFLRAGVPMVAKATDVFVVDTATGQSRAVTSGPGENWLPVWSPDGRYIALLSDRDGSHLAKLWTWELASGTLRRISDVNVRANQLEWLPDSRAILVSVLPEDVTPAGFAAKLMVSPTTGMTQAATPGSTGDVYRSTPFPEGGKAKMESPPWSLDYSLCDLAIVDISTGNVKRLDRGHRISAYFLAPNGSEVAYTSPQSFQKPGSQQILFNVMVVSLGTGELRTAASNVQLDFDGGSVRWSPDGSMLAYRTGGMEARGDCYVLDRTGGPSRNLTSFGVRHSGPSYFPPLWDSSSRYLLFTDGEALWKASPNASQATRVTQIAGHRMVRLIEDGKGTLWSLDGGASTVVPAFDQTSKRLEFYRVYLDSPRIAPMLGVGQNPASFTVGLFGAVSSDGSRFAYFSQDASHDMDLWITDPSLTSPRRLTHINPEFDRYAMGSARVVEWSSLDGELLHGALLLPSGYQQGLRYPLITWVYGGALGSDSLGQFGLLAGPFNLQLFATRGYAAFIPDIPQRMGTPMVDIEKAVLPGINKVIEMGIADENRVGVLGHSYGGYSVLSLLVQSRRFKAAAMIDGSGDLISSYGQMGKDGSAFGIALAEGGQELMGGTPWEFRDRYIENSPVFYFDRIATPLLIVHGTDDFTVAPFLGDEVFVDLRRLGKEVEYVRYRGEEHSPLNWSYTNQLDLCNRTIDWFKKYLQSEPSR
jgi:dipeptidyl aminopeptidase/acylaminoacyl peptidase